MLFNIIEERGTGKTRSLMEEAYKNNGIFVCQNAFHMREKANAYGLHGLEIISFQDFINEIQLHEFEYTNIKATGYRHEYGKKVYIDELEGFINYLCFNRFGGYTITTGIL